MYLFSLRLPLYFFLRFVSSSYSKCMLFMRSRFSLSWFRFSHTGGTTHNRKKGKIHLITVLITSEKSRLLHITSDKKYEHRTLKIPIWAFYARIQRIILLCAYEMDIECMRPMCEHEHISHITALKSKHALANCFNVFCLLKLWLINKFQHRKHRNRYRDRAKREKSEKIVDCDRYLMQK